MGVITRGTSLNISEGGKVSKRWRPVVNSKVIVVIVVIALVCLGIGIALGTGVLPGSRSGSSKGQSGNNGHETTTLPPIPNPSERMPPSISTLRVFKKAAVCSDGPSCAEIGKTILEKNGSAVDAAIATMFCNGLANMQSMGLGGGFLMTIYIKENNTAYTLNAREAAPLNATKDMFKGKPGESTKGPLSIGVPGELKGYWAAHQRFGKLPWSEIIEPSIKLCEAGFNLSMPHHNSIVNNEEYIRKDENMKSWYINEEGYLRNTGEKIVPTNLCKTLRYIAENGGEDFYTGNMSRIIAEDLKEIGSIITIDDLQNYTVKWTDPVQIDFTNGDHLYSVPPPGSGLLLGFILKILDGYNFTRNNINDLENTVLTYHRVAEAFKYAYAKRTELGDPDYVNITQLIENLQSPKFAEETRLRINDTNTSSDSKHYGAVFYNQMNDNGTAHISVLADNGDAVSVTSTLNIYHGSGLTSKRTGIIFNSGMDDFSSDGLINYFGLPGSPNNAIEPGKRALSSMSPSIVTNKAGDVKLVIGASGGTKITTAMAMVIMRVLWFGQNIKEAIDYPRLHHQVFPMDLEYEFGTLQQEIDELAKFGHNMKKFSSYSVICALFKSADGIFANADYRKGGDVYGIN